MIESLNCAGKVLDLSQPQVMGILNVTPDSFSDGGFFVSVPDAIEQARSMVLEGVAILDVGGESTRPGAKSVSAQEEIDRVIPVIDAIKQECDTIISIDTSKPDVMREAVKAGAGVINDVRALQESGALEAANDLAVPVCLMHMRGQPRTMQENPQYDDVIADVISFLRDRIKVCVEAGIPTEHLIIDPGFGFGKSVAHNLTLVKRLKDFSVLDLPVLMGVSRKSSIGTVLDKPVDQRLYGSVALATICCQLGANIIRTHDVAATVDAIKISQAVNLAN